MPGNDPQRHLRPGDVCSICRGLRSTPCLPRSVPAPASCRMWLGSRLDLSQAGTSLSELLGSEGRTSCCSSASATGALSTSLCTVKPSQEKGGKKGFRGQRRRSTRARGLPLREPRSRARFSALRPWAAACVSQPARGLPQLGGRLLPEGGRGTAAASTAEQLAGKRLAQQPGKCRRQQESGWHGSPRLAPLALRRDRGGAAGKAGRIVLQEPRLPQILGDPGGSAVWNSCRARRGCKADTSPASALWPFGLSR